MNNTTIEWAEKVWNPVTGCDSVSSGCQNCYARSETKRLQFMIPEKYGNGFKFTMHPKSLNEPFKFKKPSIVFVNSMSDLFHKNISEEFLLEVFKVMNDTPQHTYLILTKRPEQMLKYNDKINWTENIWMGVSVENDKTTFRIDLLRQCNAKTKFLSCEPLLTAIPNMNLENIDWIIVGGESGRKSRPMKKEWVTDILNQCNKYRIPFFFKQWGGKNKKKTGNLLNGLLYHARPSIKTK